MAKSDFRIIVGLGTGEEILLRTIVRELEGTQDGALFADIVKKSEPFWVPSNVTLQRALLLGSTTTTAQEHEKFVLLMQEDWFREHVQTETCDFSAVPFYYSAHKNSSGHETWPTASISMPLQKRSPFTAPLSRIVNELQSAGILGLYEARYWYNTLRFNLATSCKLDINSQSPKVHWGTLTFSGMLPPFTLLLINIAIGAGIFVIERWWVQR